MRYELLDKDTAQIKFYGYIREWWNGALDYEHTLEAIKKEGRKNLIVRVHCYGGDVMEGNAIWTANKMSGLNITYKIDGVAASMMTIVMMSANRIEISQLGRIMIHAPQGSGGGTSKAYFTIGKLLKGFEADFIKVYAAKSGKSESECAKYMDGSDHWFTADEAVKEKLVDAIMPETLFMPAVRTKPAPGDSVEGIFGTFTAMAEVDEQNQISDMTKEQKSALIAEHNLTGVTADSSDTAVLDAVSASIAALRQKVQQFEQGQVNQITEQVNGLLAIKTQQAGIQFTDAEKTNLINIAKAAGIESFKAALEMIKPAPLLSNIITPGGAPSVVAAEGAPKGRENWTMEEWRKNDPLGLERLSVSTAQADVAYFATLYKAEYGTVPMAGTVN